MKILTIIFGVLFIAISAGAQSHPSLISYDAVDPFIGTAEGGNTFPAATLPFGMIQWGPDTRDDGWYHFGDKSIRGLSLTHISGAGCPAFADVPILPILSADTITAGAGPSGGPNAVNEAFVHQREHAHPGTYSVTFDNRVTAELAVSLRAGIGRFTFPAGSHPTFLFKTGSSATAAQPGRDSDTSSVETLGIDTLTGTVHSGGFCSSDTNYVLYFAARFDRPFSSYGVWDTSVKPGLNSVGGRKVGAFVTFQEAAQPVVMKVAISFVSIENAQANLQAEIPGWDFDGVRAAARNAWESVLDHVRTTGGTPTQQTLFYTSLYHMMLAPTLFNDEDGSYIGFDERVHRLAPGQQQYANFSDWDIYRNVIQFHTLLFPTQASQEAESLIRDAEQSGWLPRWPIANDVSYIMGGDSTPIVISSAYAFGARSFDAQIALRYMLKGATTPGNGKHDLPERPGLAEYHQLGYVPLLDGSFLSDGRDENAFHQSSASVTLEYAASDFAISRFAASLGDSANARRLLSVSGTWRSLFDAQSGFIRPRKADQQFMQEFDPDHLFPRHTNWDKEDQLGFEEGSAWQYTWMIPQDYGGLFRLMGGPSAVVPKLDKFFATVTGWGKPTFTVVNEPDFGAPFAYLWLGYPWKTQEVIDRIRREAFFNSPGGLPGNDDLGATSGVYVWNALGLYPEIPGVGGLAVGTPMFPAATIRKEDGSTIEIVSQGDGIYVQNLKLNGTNYRSTWIPLSRLTAKRNRIEFTLAAHPNRSWASTAADYPPSFSASPGKEIPR